MTRQISGTKIFQLKLTLAHVKPLVWRRITVPGTIRLDELHMVLQAAMGWHDAHMHQFVFQIKPKLPTRKDLVKARLNLRQIDLAEIRGVRVYSLPEFQLHDAEDESQVTLQELISGSRAKFTYIYDFGDDWIHEIAVEKVIALAKSGNPIRCLAGQGACPPEDSGGPHVYLDMVKALKNPKHPGHERAKHWLGRFNPAKFSRAEADRAVQKAMSI